MTDHKETTKVQACPSVVVRCCHRVDKHGTASVPEDSEDMGVDGWTVLVPLVAYASAIMDNR